MLKQPRIKSRKHLKFIATLPCCVTGLEGETQAAHIRSGDAGIGMKSQDNRTVPLHFEEHRRQHSFGSEHKYWGQYGGIEEAISLARKLYHVSGDEQIARYLVWEFRNDN